ncbi:MAG: hypothetical protein HS116_22400 [Planctomycetes bacterium]|nr:hypothetical protein [Planctomycetota bacterium]
MTPCTLILLTVDRIARADFSASAGDAPRVAQALRSAEATPADSVRAALGLGGRPHRDVWVLTEDAWTQSMVLSLNQIAGLGDEQIARALGFEVEPLSGLPAEDTAVGFCPAEQADGMQSYRVTALPRQEVDDLRQAVRERGGRLKGVAHPGGLPRPIGRYEARESWRRLELWSKGTLWIKSDDGQHAHARVLNATPGQPAWQRFSAFIDAEAAGHSELLSSAPTALGTEIAPHVTWRRFTLDDEPSLGAWLRAWAEQVASRTPGIPLIVPPELPTSQRTFVAVGAAALALTVLLCFAWGKSLTADRDAASAELDRLRKPAAQLDALKRKTDTVKKEHAQLLQANADAERTVTLLGTHLGQQRKALALLLRTLAESRPEDVVVERVESKADGQMTISGMALESGLADELATRLSARLQHAGMLVMPARKQALYSLKSGGPWTFEVGVQRGEAPGAVTASTSARRRSRPSSEDLP